MPIPAQFRSFLALGTLVCACGSEQRSEPQGEGGAQEAGGAKASGGTASGGASMGGNAAGGASAGNTNGGALPQTGGSASGGASSQGGKAGGNGGSANGGASTGGSSASMGGSANGGSAGTATNSGGTAGAAAVMGSTGCGKGGKPSSTNVPNTIVTFPTAYDGTKPMPLVFGFHGAGNTNQSFQTTNAHISGSDLEKNYVMAYLKSAGNAWDNTADPPRLDAAFDQITQNYCIDLNRVFATGHSSGAQFIVQRLCAGEKRFRAVAPVAASKYCAKITPGIGTLYIQGQMDAQRNNSNGKDVVDVFVASNGCSMTSTAYDVPMCNSTFDNMPVTPGCIQYQGCMFPTLWCSHNDNGYNATDGKMHGWPCFATKLIYDFFETFK